MPPTRSASEPLTLVYLHGFRSSPASAKASAVRAAVTRIEPALRPRLEVPALPDRPAQAMEAIDRLAAGCDPSGLGFIGSSLGGFYATVAAERYGARAVLINPTVCPDEDLRDQIGPRRNLYTGATFEVTDAHFDELRALRVLRITRPERYFLLAQSGDEVLDYRQAVRFYAGAWQFVQGGGDHGFVQFDAQLPAVFRFLGVTP
jgi:uncharacterized protein